MRFAPILLVVCLAGSWPAAATQASKFFKEGLKAERAGRMAEAYLLYSRAAALVPGKQQYWLKSQAVRTRAALQVKLAPPPSSADSAGPEPELGELENVSERDLRETRKPQPPKELKASSIRAEINLKADAKVLFEQVAKLYGLDVVFDGDYQPGPPIAFRLDQADYREALHALQAATNSFVIPLGDKLLLVSKDTPQKRVELEPTVTVVVPIPNPVSVQEAQELARSVQQLMEIRRFGVDSTRRLVIINDRVSKVRPAQQIFEDLLYHRAEVSIELQFVEVNRNDITRWGLSVPTSFALFNQSVRSPLPAVAGYLLKIGGGATLFGIGIPDPTLIAEMSQSRARTLLRSHIRSIDGQPATFHVGDKYPILTSGYFGPASFSDETGGGQLYTPPPSFNFEDLGLNVKITPKIHGTEEVSLDIEAEFKVLGGEAINGIPIISSRKLTSKVRLKNNEWGIVAGMMNGSEARSITGLAGLARIPGLGALVSRRENTKDRSEVLILMKPRLLSLPPDQVLTRTLWVGSESRLNSPL